MNSEHTSTTTRIRTKKSDHDLSDAEIKRFFKKHGIDTRKHPPTREQLFALLRDVFHQGANVDVLKIRYNHAVH